MPGTGKGNICKSLCVSQSITVRSLPAIVDMLILLIMPSYTPSRARGHPLKKRIRAVLSIIRSHACFSLSVVSLLRSLTSAMPVDLRKDVVRLAELQPTNDTLLLGVVHLKEGLNHA